MESFLEDLNNILSSGDVPNIYEAEDLDGIYMSVRHAVMEMNLPATKANLFACYQKRVRSNLHMVVVMSPVGEVCDIIMLIFFFSFSHCSHASHFELVCNKINKFAYVLNQLRKTSTLETVLTSYYGYVYSTLKYGILIWGNSTDLKRAFIAQKRCVRAITGKAPYESCKPIFKSLGILTLPSIYILEIAMFVKLNPIFFKTATDRFPRGTRNRERLVLNKTPRTATYLKSCSAMCVKVFNAIPKPISTLPTSKLKTALKKWLLHNAFYSVGDFLQCKC